MKEIRDRKDLRSTLFCWTSKRKILTTLLIVEGEGGRGVRQNTSRLKDRIHLIPRPLQEREPLIRKDYLLRVPHKFY